LKVKRENENKERDQHRQEMETFRKSFEQDVKGILNTEQQQKFDELRKIRRPPNNNKE